MAEMPLINGVPMEPEPAPRPERSRIWYGIGAVVCGGGLVWMLATIVRSLGGADPRAVILGTLPAVWVGLAVIAAWPRVPRRVRIAIGVALGVLLALSLAQFVQLAAV